MAYRSYAEQAQHYFTRPHESIRRTALDVDAAWEGPEVAGRDDWRYVLDAGEVEEIEAALAKARATGKANGDLTVDDFPLPGLVRSLSAWRREIAAGRGFQVVSGIPVQRWPTDVAELFFWCLGLHLGRPGGQNPQGDLLGHVRDTGDDAADPFVRLYRTTSNIAYHCDAADAVGLLCLRAARKGGASRIVSSVSVYNAFLTRRPEWIDRLYEPYALDLRNEDESGVLRHLPIPPCRFADGRLRTFYHSDYFRSAVRYDDVALGDRDRAVLDLYEEIASDPALYFDMDLAPGDVQLLSNHVVLHARTGYDDHPEPERKRHLLRLWLSLD